MCHEKPMIHTESLLSHNYPYQTLIVCILHQCLGIAIMWPLGIHWRHDLGTHHRHPGGTLQAARPAAGPL